MDVTKKFADSIIKGFENDKIGNKVALGLTSPLWFTGLVVSGTLEGVFDVSKGAVDAVGNVTGTVGDCTFKKLKNLEKMSAALNSKGIEATVEFEKGIYKIDRAIALVKTKTLNQEQETILLQSIAKAITSANNV